jgi:hypothetical protein
MTSTLDEARRSLLGPSISLIVVSSLGLLLSLYSFWSALIFYFESPALTKDASKIVGRFGDIVAENEKDLEKKEILRKSMGGLESIIQPVGEMWQRAAGSSAVYMGIMSLLNGFILAGGISMLTLRLYGLSVAGSIIALIPTVGPCCILSLPFGIWALVVLSRSHIRASFNSHV